MVNLEKKHSLWKNMHLPDDDDDDDDDDDNNKDIFLLS
jgi:hypothetical protein